MSFLGKLFGKKEKESLDQGLEKTKQGFLERISKAIIGKTSVDEEVLDQLEEALIGADVGVDTTLALIEKIQDRVKKEKYISTSDLNKILHEEIVSLLIDAPTESLGFDPSAVAFDTIQSAMAKKANVVLIDTAGRLHNKVNLMEELNKIKRVIQKQMPEAPHEVLLVLDGSTGQNALEQAKQFMAVTNVTALAITKLDGTAKGGVVLAIAHQCKIPVKYIGVGEQIKDLLLFDKDEFVDSLFNLNKA